MDIIKVSKKCALCGKEEDYTKILSNFIFGNPNLDLKPNGSMADLGSEIDMCPHCGYCNFDVEKPIKDGCRMFTLEEWEKDEEIQKIIKSDHSIALKKYLIMSILYKRFYVGNETIYNMLIKASWVTESKEHAKELRESAIEFFMENILPDIRTKIF